MRKVTAVATVVALALAAISGCSAPQSNAPATVFPSAQGTGAGGAGGGMGGGAGGGGY